MSDAESLSFGMAGSGQRERAIALQDAVYREELGATLSDDPTIGEYIVAWDDVGEIVASCRIVGPEARPFEIEAFVNLDGVIRSAERTALGGRLCIAPNCRGLGTSVRILAGLLGSVAELAGREGWTQLLIYPRSSLVGFYRAARFLETGLRFVDPRFGLEMHVMHVEIAELVRRVGVTSQRGRSSRARR